MPETWLSRCERYVEARTSGNESRWRELEADLQRDFAHGQLSESDVNWLTGALTDSDAALREEVKWFVEFVLRVTPPLVAAPLFDPLIKTAVYERTRVTTGTSSSPASGAPDGSQRRRHSWCTYVTGPILRRPARSTRFIGHWAIHLPTATTLRTVCLIHQNRKANHPVPPGIALRIFLEEFVRNPDVDVRRSIVPHLHDVSRYHSDLEGLAQEARRIGLSHPDEYIQARAEITWGDHHGEKVQFPALPHRPPPAEE
jgi:hypothetical protein